MIIKIVRWLFGYIIFEIKGGNIEKLINISVQNNINFWNLKKHENIMLGQSNLNDYKTLNNIVKQTNSEIKLIKKCGLPFFIYKLKNKIGLLIGIIIFLLSIYIFSLYIWNISIEGNGAISSEEIINIINELGLSPGTLKNRINVPILKQLIMSKNANISWVAINIKGTSAIISIKEGINKPNTILLIIIAVSFFVFPKKGTKDLIEFLENKTFDLRQNIISKDKPCNVTAKKDGQIERLETYNGTNMVNVGDVVTKDQILISGVVENYFGSNSFVHADGNIIAKTRHSIKEKVEPLKIETIDTGKKTNKYRIKIFGIEIPLGFKKSPPENYKIDFYSDDFKINSIKLPITIYKEIWHEIKDNEIILSPEEAKDYANQKILNRETKELSGINIIEKNVSELFENGEIYLQADYLCLENIANKEDFLFE